MAKNVRAKSAAGNGVRRAKAAAAALELADAKAKADALHEAFQADLERFRVDPSMKVIEEGPLDGKVLSVEGMAVEELLLVDLDDAAQLEAFRTRFPVRSPERPPPTVVDLAAARDLVDLVGQALIFGDAAKWKRIRDAFAVMRGIGTDDAIKAACCKALDGAASTFARVKSDRDRHGVAVGAIRRLAFHVPALGDLTPEMVQGVLEMPVKSSRRLAHLCLDVGALGCRKHPADVGKALEAAVKMIDRALERHTAIHKGTR